MCTMAMINDNNINKSFSFEAFVCRNNFKDYFIDFRASLFSAVCNDDFITPEGRSEQAKNTLIWTKKLD